MTWTATPLSVEYLKPTYRLAIMLKKNGMEVGEKIIEIEDSLSFEDAVERIKDELREQVSTETLGAKLNKQIGKEITL